jgi:hypothetical protein
MLAGALLAAPLPVSCLAQDSDAGQLGNDQVVALDTVSAISSQAQAVLDRMNASLDALKQFSVTAHVTRDEILPFGYKLQNTESATMSFKWPHGLRVEVEGDIKDRTYVYDGSQLVMYAPDANAYATTPAPKDIGDLVRQLMDAGVEMPLIDLLYHGSAGSLTEAVRVGILVGETKVDGIPADHLAFRQADLDWQLWVDKGPQALPLKLVITTRYSLGDPQYQARLHWNLKPRLDSGAFRFEPPAGTRKIPFRTSLFSVGDDE